MKVALIPPLGWERYINEGTMGMSLAQVEDPDYRAAFLKYSWGKDSHLIIDNGAAEGDTVANHTLMQVAGSIGAHEIVLPDVPGDRVGTIQAVHQFLRFNKRYVYSDKTQYMGVVQGRTIAQLQDCISYYAGRPEITCVGIPRHLLTSVGPQSIRVDLANWIKNEGLEIQVHMLGTHRAYPAEARWFGSYTPHVRSIDTSAPFVYAMAGYALGNTTKQVDRVPTYLKERYSVPEPHLSMHRLVMYNIGVLKRWTNGTKETPTSGM